MVVDQILSGKQLFKFIELLWPFNRSITGTGTLRTLEVIRDFLPGLKIIKFSTGDKCFDWEIPLEWNVRAAYIIGPNGNKVVDIESNNLHLVSYSQPVSRKLSLEELNQHLHSLPKQPDLIPYRTTYYKKDWGFCIKDSVRKNLISGEYTVYIDSELKPGHLNLGEFFIKGESDSEIIFSTYVCHPSMANNELSGPAIAVALAQYLSQRKPYYSYRFLFTPETIGTVAYVSKKFKSLKKNVVAGFVLTCLGDQNAWSYLPSRTGITLSDKIAKRVLKNHDIKFDSYSFLDRGSDERQYCSPLIDLPFCSIMRSKYGTYDVYHTSGDNLNFISEQGLQDSLDFYIELIQEFENNRIPIAKIFAEPRFSKYGMRGGVGAMPKLDSQSVLVSNICALADGSFDYHELSLLLKVPTSEIIEQCQNLKQLGLIAVK